MVKVVVYLDIVGTKFLVVGHDVVERDDFATVIHLAVDGIGCDALVADDGLLHVFLHLVIAAAARTKCAQQHDGIDSNSFHINYR